MMELPKRHATRESGPSLQVSRVCHIRHRDPASSSSSSSESLVGDRCTMILLSARVWQLKQVPAADAPPALCQAAGASAGHWC